MKPALSVMMFFCFLYQAKATDSVTVKKDPRLDMLTARQISINKLTSNMTSNGQYKGYRLQILNTRSREEAFKVKAELLQHFPDQKAYALFQSPYFKVRFGNYIEKAEAERSLFMA